MGAWDHFIEARRSDIKRLEQELDAVDGVHDVLLRQIRHLYQEIGERDRQIEQLQWMMDTLLETLDRAGVISARQFETQWKEFQKLSLDAQQNKVPTTHCARCTKEVPVQQTYFSDVGEVCYACFEKVKYQEEDDLSF